MKFLPTSLCAALLLAASAPAVQALPVLVPLSTYNTGLGEDGAEILDARDGFAVVSSAQGSVDILDTSFLFGIKRLSRITLDTTSGTPNSVAIHPTKPYFLVALGSPGSAGKVLAYGLDGVFLAEISTGIQPDSVAISPDGNFAVVANEAEGVDIGDDGGPGSLTLIDLRAFDPATGNLTLTAQLQDLVSQAGTPGFSVDRTDGIATLPVDNSPATLEPESVAFSPNSAFAYVTLQENNGVVRFNLSTLERTYFGLGQVNHLADLTDDDGYNPVETLTAFREPDGIDVTPNGQFLVTADEGDTNDSSGEGGPRGGRTLSIFNASSGALVADTGRQIDEVVNAAGLYDLLVDGSRSDRGGSEPEGLDVTDFKGLVLAAVGLERANAVLLIDITVPTAPRVVTLGQTGTAPEGVKFLKRSGRLYLLTANEVAGTVTAFQVVIRP